MAIVHSLILNVLAPESVTDEIVLKEALSLVQKTKVKAIEYYAPFSSIASRVQIMKDMGFEKVVYLIAGRQKGEKKWLNALDEEERRTAVDFTLEALDAAMKAGCSSFLVTSGANVSEEKRPYAFEALDKSMEEIFRAAGNALDIVMEPGDTSIDARQLIGPTSVAAEYAEKLRAEHKNFYLTLDTSHIAQLGEEFDKAFAIGNGVSNHLHLASCILKEGHPLYGDKHPLFSTPDGVYTPESLKAVYEKVVNAYEKANRDLTIGVEIIDRTGRRLGSLEDAIAESPWFF